MTVRNTKSKCSLSVSSSTLFNSRLWHIKVECLKILMNKVLVLLFAHILHGLYFKIISLGWACKVLAQNNSWHTLTSFFFQTRWVRLPIHQFFNVTPVITYSFLDCPKPGCKFFSLYYWTFNCVSWC